MAEPTPKHAGLLIPLDMFRISQLAALFADQLVSKARNILDAKLVLTRHPDAPILLVRIEGHVVGDDPPAFWRENADLAALASRLFPRQVILYYAEPGPPSVRREGFAVAQQGQVVAADDATLERLPPDATEADWPVVRLCMQLRVSEQALAKGFPGGPSVEVSLVDTRVDDQALLLRLLGRDGEGDLDEDEPAPPPPPPRPAAAPAARGRAAAGPPAGAGAAPAAAAAKPRVNLEADAKRRAQLQADQEAKQQRRAAEIRAALPYAEDELGLVVAPRAELSEPNMLRPYIQASVAGDLPPGLPNELTDALQGRRIDLAVRVEFLSEVFVENTPLSRATFQARAQPVEIDGRTLQVLEVLGPRLGYGVLVSTGKTHVFVSRKFGMPLPFELLLGLLGD